MKKWAVLLLLAGAPLVSWAQAPSMAYCLNPSLQWIPVNASAAVGQALSYRPSSIPLYGTYNGARYPLQCDASGNLLVSGGGAGATSASQTLRQTLAKLSKIETTGAGSLIVSEFGDSTGDMTGDYIIQRLIARHGLMGWSSIGAGSGWQGGVSGGVLYSASRGVSGFSWGMIGSQVGDCGQSSVKDYVASPFGVLYELGHAVPSAQCTMTNSLEAPGNLGNNGYSTSLPVDTLKVVYVTEPGAGTITVSVGDDAGTPTYVQMASVSAAAGSLGVGVISLGPAQLGGKITRWQITNGVSGRVRIILMSAYDSTKSGVMFNALSVGGTGIDGILGIYNQSRLATVLGAMPGPDLLISEWKNNSGLTAAQYKTYLQSLYSTIQPYGYGYNASTAPDPVDVLLIGSYVDNVAGVQANRDFASAAREVATSKRNAFFYDESYTFDKYDDALAMGLGADGVHLSLQGIRFFGDKAWHALGFESTSTVQVAQRRLSSEGSAAAPAVAWLNNPKMGAYLDGATATEHSVGTAVRHGSFLVQQAATPASPVITSMVPGATSYSYDVCGIDAYGAYLCSATVTIATGNASLASGPNMISHAGIPTAKTCIVRRTAGGASQGQLGVPISCQGQPFSIIDNGIVAGANVQATYPAWFGVNFTPTLNFPIGFSANSNPASAVSGSLRISPVSNWIKEWFCPAADTNGSTCASADYNLGYLQLVLPGNIWNVTGSGSNQLARLDARGFGWSVAASPFVSNTDTRVVKDSGQVPVFLGTLTTTAAATDAIPGAAFTLKTGQIIGRITATSNCFAQPNNGTAAGTVWFSGYGAGSVTVNHAVTAGMGYDIWCAGD